MFYTSFLFESKEKTDIVSNFVLIMTLTTILFSYLTDYSITIFIAIHYSSKRVHIEVSVKKAKTISLEIIDGWAVRNFLLLVHVVVIPRVVASGHSLSCMLVATEYNGGHRRSWEEMTGTSHKLRPYVRPCLSVRHNPVKTIIRLQASFTVLHV